MLVTPVTTETGAASARVIGGRALLLSASACDATLDADAERLAGAADLEYVGRSRRVATAVIVDGDANPVGKLGHDHADGASAVADGVGDQLPRQPGWSAPAFVELRAWTLMLLS